MAVLFLLLELIAEPSTNNSNTVTEIFPANTNDLIALI